MDIPEVVVLEILALLPLKSIARFRSVKKDWRLLIDSDFFRDYFISLNSSSSVSWSIIQMKPHKLTLEIVGHHGCKVLGLTQSPGSLMRFLPVSTRNRKVSVLACTDGLVLIYAKARGRSSAFYIGNPLFQEWFRISLPKQLSSKDVRRINKGFVDPGLVTKMQSGMECGTCRQSSELWSMQGKSIALNGILHWLPSHTSCIVAYSLYGGYNDGGDASYRVIHFPGSRETCIKRTFTTSEGCIVYFNEFREENSRILRGWRLVKYTDVVTEAWQLFWEVNLMSMVESGIDYFPVVMHPLKSEIIYLWSMNKKSLILYNLKTHVFSLHKETEVDSKCMDGCVLSFNGCEAYMEEIYRNYLPMNQCFPSHLFFSQYVLPGWLHHLPRPQPT